MSNPNMEAKIKELQELKHLREELEAEITAIEDEIKQTMGEEETLFAGAFKVTWKAVTSSRFDSSAFKKAMPELAAQYTKTTTTRRFTVAQKKRRFAERPNVPPEPPRTGVTSPVYHAGQSSARRNTDEERYLSGSYRQDRCPA